MNGRTRSPFFISALAALVLVAPAAAQTDGAGPPTIEEITVIGRYPGPPLWKITSGARTLWVFGELSPVPIDHWRDVVARSFVDPDFAVPGGESGRDTLARGWAALEPALASPARVTALVSHGQISSLVLHHIGPPFGYEGWQRLSNPDVYRDAVGH